MRKNFYKELLIDYEKDHKKFWRVINGLIPGQPNNKKNIDLCDQNTGELVPEEKTADFINHYFTQIGPDLARDLRVPWMQYDERSDNFIEPFSTNLQEVNKLIHEINVNKSSAIDNVSSKILKMAFKHMPEKLVKIFNLSFTQNIIPES